MRCLLPLIALSFSVACSASKENDSGLADDTGAASDGGGESGGGDGGSGGAGSGDGGSGDGGSADGGSGDGGGGDAEECGDGIDNDGNGFGDCSDEACEDDAGCTCLTGDLGNDVGARLATGSNLSSTNDFDGPGTTPGGRDEAWSWSAPTAGCWAADTVGSTYDTVLRSFDACGGEQLAYNDDHGPADARLRQSRLVVGAENVGDAYIFVVDSFSPDATEQYQGDFVLNISAAEPYGGASPTDLASRVGTGVASGTTSGTVQAPTACQQNAGGLDAYVWTAPEAAAYVFDTNGSELDTVLSIYGVQGCEERTCDDDGGNDGASRIELELSAGEAVRIMVQGFNGYTGDYILNINPA